MTTVICSLLFLLSALSPYIPPTRFATPAFMGLFFPIFLLMQIGITVYWLIRLQWKVLVALLIVWFIGWESVSSYIPVNRQAETSAEMPRIKVLSYNVGAFGFVEHTKGVPNPIFQYIRSSEADIVCLQEAMISAHIPWAVISAGQLKSYFRDIYPYIHIGQGQERGTTLILLSKYPITESRRIEMSSRTNGAMYYELSIQGRRVRLINAHLESFRLRSHDGEQYVALARQGDARGLREVLQAKLSPAFRRRNVQANLLHEEIHSSDEPIIVCGDFNDTPVSYTYRKVLDGLIDTFAESGNGFGFSYTSGVFVVRIDHIFASREFVPEGALVDRTIKTSDHYPVTTYLRWRDLVR